MSRSFWDEMNRDRELEELNDVIRTIRPLLAGKSREEAERIVNEQLERMIKERRNPEFEKLVREDYNSYIKGSLLPWVRESEEKLAASRMAQARERELKEAERRKAEAERIKLIRLSPYDIIRTQKHLTPAKELLQAHFDHYGVPESSRKRILSELEPQLAKLAANDLDFKLAEAERLKQLRGKLGGLRKRKEQRNATLRRKKAFAKRKKWF